MNEQGKTERVTLRMTPADAARLREQAAADGCSVSECVRARVAGRRARPRRSATESERAELARILGEIGKIGSNVNQVARRANEGGRVDWETLAAMRAELEAWRDVLTQALPERP